MCVHVNKTAVLVQCSSDGETSSSGPPPATTGQPINVGLASRYAKPTGATKVPSHFFLLLPLLLLLHCLLLLHDGGGVLITPIMIIIVYMLASDVVGNAGCIQQVQSLQLVSCTATNCITNNLLSAIFLTFASHFVKCKWTVLHM